MGQAISLPFKLIETTRTFWGGLFYYLAGPGRHQEYKVGRDTNFPYLKVSPDDSQEQALFKQHARIHLFSMASSFYLYGKRHYRKGSYRDDLLDNLRNVAIPGTGIPLSLFVRSKWLALAFVTTATPVVSFMAALHHWWRTGESISKEYATRLLAPNDWFSYWRLNCNVVGLHSYLWHFPRGYQSENKWNFLVQGEQLGVPVSPYLKTPAIVVKHRNEEGGLGIYFYRNAADGGDWIIQERILNSDWVSTLLPSKAPLSTFRVITQSRASLDLTREPQTSDVTALSCVFRAGRRNAATDHDSILFDVNVKTGEIQGGTTNAHWYRLGLFQWMTCPWRSEHSYTHHPDGPLEGKDIAVTGKVVPNVQSMLQLVEQSHLKLCSDVPFAGWDVVLSADEQLPVCLLEVNLSCNFFRGSFDKKVYLDFINDSFQALQARRLASDQRI
jgi:hypothetical protein